MFSMAIHFCRRLRDGERWKSKYRPCSVNGRVLVLRLQYIFTQWATLLLKWGEINVRKRERTKSVLLLGMIKNDARIPLECTLSADTSWRKLDGVLWSNECAYYYYYCYYYYLSLFIIASLAVYHKFHKLLCMLNGSLSKVTISSMFLSLPIH